MSELMDYDAKYQELIENEENIDDDDSKSNGGNSSSSSSDSDENIDFEEKLNLLKKSIEDNKFVYQNYVDIIELTRSNGDLNNLRTYREKMSELFPLTESN
jgi:hypothetical protein